MPEPAQPVYHLYRWLWGSLDLLFPPICVGCGRSGYHWCDQCQQQAKLIKSPICNICGQPFQTTGLCDHCSSRRPKFTALRSWAIYDGPVREAIRYLKYRRNISLGIILSQPLNELFSSLSWGVDMVIPVPLGVARLKERGYNQAGLIAKPLALRIGVPCESQGLHRVRETRSQVGLSFDQRRDNVKNAFQAKQDIVLEHNILVVDDVATSSATLNACAAALLAAGAYDIYCLTYARTG